MPRSRSLARCSSAAASLVSEGFQWGLYVTGESADAMMGLFLQTAEQLNAS